MDNTFHEDMITSFEVDSAAYKDAMEEELVDHLELAGETIDAMDGEKVTDEVLRKLLTQFKQASFMQENAVDTLDSEVMDVVADASIKND